MPFAGSVLCIHSDELPALPPLPSQGGVREEEAIALLRLFYAQENQGAPAPQKRTRRQLELAEAAAAAVRGEPVKQASRQMLKSEGAIYRPSDDHGVN